MDPTSLIPAKYAGIVLTILAILKITDSIVRLIPDKFLKAHTTVEMITDFIKNVANYFANKPAAGGSKETP